MMLNLIKSTSTNAMIRIAVKTNHTNRIDLRTCVAISEMLENMLNNIRTAQIKRSSKMLK